LSQEIHPDAKDKDEWKKIEKVREKEGEEGYRRREKGRCICKAL
jgi:hypothetical protein